ncbi:MAG: VWA domain-containing protein [Chitinophagales bacterium]|nr:VWA domain-containing protein [Chitinophagales bacterium]
MRKIFMTKTKVLKQAFTILEFQLNKLLISLLSKFQLLVFFGILLSDIKAQSFLKNIGNPAIDDGVCGIQVYQKKLFVSGYSSKQCYLASYSLDGELIWKKYFEFSEHQNFISDFIVDDEKIILCGYGHDSGSDIFDEFFVSYDYQKAEINWARKTGISLKPNNLHIYNGSILISGDEYAKGKFGIFFLQLNIHKGKSENFTTWYYSGNESSAISKIENDTIYSGGRYGIKAKSDKYRASISQFNASSFDEIQSNYFLNSKQDFARAYLSDMIIKDDSIIAACFSNNHGIDNNYSISLFNTLKNGSVNWAYEYEILPYTSISLKDMLELKDGYLLLGLSKAPTEDLILLKLDKEAYPEYAYAIGGAYAENMILDQGKFIAQYQNHLYLAAQSKSISLSGDYDSFIMDFEVDAEFNDSCMQVVRLDAKIKSYEDLIEGEIGLSEYDTIFKEMNIPFIYAKSKTESDQFVCKTKLEEDKIEPSLSFENIAFNNTIFLMDASLSMNTEDRMPILKSSLYKLLAFMRLEDKISAVSYASEASVILNGESATNIAEIKSKIENIPPSGQSDIIAGLEMALSIAKENFKEELNNRIIVTTDGDLSFNKQKELKALLEKTRDKNIVVSIFLFNKSSLYFQQLKEIVDAVGANLYVVSRENIEEVLTDELKAKKK